MPSRFPASPSRRRALAGVIPLVTLLLSACVSVPNRGQVVMRDVAFPLRDFRLASGLRVVVEEDKRSPVVAVVALVGSGGSSDPASKEGLAHVVEHLAFRARHAGSPSVWTRLEQVNAGGFNAFTSLDHTAYQTLAPRESLAELLKLEGQRLSAPLAGVTEEVFAVEREVVRNELRQRNETGYVGQVLSWLQAASFPAGHPYARPIIGTHETLTGLTLADAQRFVRKNYQPENVTLVITGDVDLQTVDAVLKASLPAAWHGEGPALAVSPRLPQPAPEPPLAPAAATLVAHEAAVASPELYLGWVLPRGFDEASAVHDFVRASLIRELMGAAFIDGDIAGMNTGLIPGTRASLLLVRVVLNKGDHPERTAQKVLDQVYRVWNSEGEASDVLGRQVSFQQMHRGVTVGMALESEHLLARAVRRAELTHFSLDARAYGRTQAALAALDGSKVTDFAYRWLQRERVRMVLVRPGESGVPALAAAPQLPPDETAEAPLAARPVAPAAPPALTTLRLENGLEVVLAPRPGLPLVTVGVALGGGEASGPKPGVAELADMASFPGSRFEGTTADFGLHQRVSLRRDHLRFGMSGAAGNVGNMLAILAEEFSSMKTEAQFLVFLSENVLPWHTAVDARPEVQANRVLMSSLYGSHRYGLPAAGADLTAVTQGQVEDWLDAVYRPGNAVAVVSGEFDVKEVEPLVRHYLGGWGGKGPAVPVDEVDPPAAGASKPTTFFVPRPGATQGHVQLACRLPAATPESAARYEVMAELLRSRMWHQVREQMGATYGFAANATLARGGAAHLQVEGVVDAAKLGPVLTAAREVLATYGREGVPAAELERARSRLLARHAVALTTSDAWVDALLDARLQGWEAVSVSRQPERLGAVTAADLQKDFAGCAGRMVVGVIADEQVGRAAAQTAFPVK